MSVAACGPTPVRHVQTPPIDVVDAGPSAPPLACIAPTAPPLHEDMALRFAREIYPLLTDATTGCIACHAPASGRRFLVREDARTTFERAWDEGFFATDSANPEADTIAGR